MLPAAQPHARPGRSADRSAAGLGYPFCSPWANVSSWWAIRHLPNLLFLHFAGLKRGLPGQIRKVAAFLEITLDGEAFAAAGRHCSFEYMKAHADKSAPNGGRLFNGGAQTFFHKGTNGRWRDILSADDCLRYETAAQDRLGRPCARWLAQGGSASKAAGRLDDHSNRRAILAEPFTEW